jgi:hypothetical protein
MAGEDVRAVKVYRRLVQDLLDKSAQVKRDGGIEPPLTDADLGDAIYQIQQGQEGVIKDQGQQAHYAVVETAFREKFYNLLVSLPAYPAITWMLIMNVCSPQPRLTILPSSKYGISLTLSLFFRITVTSTILYHMES